MRRRREPGRRHHIGSPVNKIRSNPLPCNRFVVQPQEIREQVRCHPAAMDPGLVMWHQLSGGIPSYKCSMLLVVLADHRCNRKPIECDTNRCKSATILRSFCTTVENLNRCGALSANPPQRTNQTTLGWGPWARYFFRGQFRRWTGCRSPYSLATKRSSQCIV